MSTFTAIPVQLKCSECGLVLLEAHIDVELHRDDADIERAWMLVDHINLTCPQCKVLIQGAADDFTRVLSGLEELEGERDEGA